MHTLRLLGAEKTFRAGKIVCLARNYVDHIRELANEIPAQPVIFMKPSTSLIGEGETVVIPPFSKDCHHEVELAVLIGRRGKDIPESEVMEHIAGYGVAIDLTLRDVQNDLKKKGLPWEIAKGFDTACPISDFIPSSRISDPHNLRISLEVNGKRRQDASTSLMMRRIEPVVHYISTIFTLEEGDIILTGTPAGVGPVVSGDRLAAEIENVGRLEVMVL